MLEQKYIFQDWNKSILYHDQNVQKISYKNLLLLFLAIIFVPGLFFPIAIFFSFYILFQDSLKVSQSQLKQDQVMEYYFLKFLAIKNKKNTKAYWYRLQSFELQHFSGKDVQKKQPSNMQQNNTSKKRSNKTPASKIEKTTRSKTPQQNDEDAWKQAVSWYKSKSVWDDYTSVMDEFKK